MSWLSVLRTPAARLVRAPPVDAANSAAAAAAAAVAVLPTRRLLSGSAVARASGSGQDGGSGSGSAAGDGSGSGGSGSTRTYKQELLAWQAQRTRYQSELHAARKQFRLEWLAQQKTDTAAEEHRLKEVRARKAARLQARRDKFRIDESWRCVGGRGLGLGLEIAVNSKHSRGPWAGLGWRRKIQREVGSSLAHRKSQSRARRHSKTEEQVGDGGGRMRWSSCNC